MKKVVIGVVFQEIIKTFLYLTALELVISQKISMTYIKNLVSLQIHIEFNI